MLDKHMGVIPKYKRGEFAEGPSFHQYYNKSFAASTEDFEKILKEMKHGMELAGPDQPATVDVRAYTRGGEMEFKNLSEVVSYGNQSDERLQSIGISAKRQDGSMASMVRFQDYFPGWSVSVIVEGGDEQASLGLFNKLRSCIEPTFQWYSFLLSTRFWIGLTAIVVIAYLASLVGVPLLREMEVLPPPPGAQTGVIPVSELGIDVGVGAQTSEAGAGSANLLELGIIVVVALFVTMVVLPYLCPRGVFLIGDEIKRAAMLSKLRWILLLVVVLLPAAAIVNRLT